MKKLGVILLFFLFAQTLSAQTCLNKIGVDFFSPYMVKTPKYDLPGNKYNPYLEQSTSGSFGFFYERLFKNHAFGLKTGAYLNKQFDDLVSVYVPVEFDGDMFGKSNESTFFAGYTVGFNLNFMANFTGAYIYPVNVVDIEFLIKKNFYIAPYAGIHAGINLNHLFFSFEGLFNFFVPEFVAYKIVYKNEAGKEITEYNTNANWGVSLRAGIGFRF